MIHASPTDGIERIDGHEDAAPRPAWRWKRQASKKRKRLRPEPASGFEKRMAEERTGRTSLSCRQTHPETASVMTAEEYRDIGTPPPWQNAP
jgi:hypothetical protein